MKRKLALTVTLLLTAGVCIVPERSITAARAALALCATALLPSLFVFFVLSGLLLRLGLGQLLQKKTAWLFRSLFAVGGSGAGALLLGWVSGYPVGTTCVKTLYQSGQISKTEAERLLAWCNTTGPLFVLGTVGSVLLGDAHAGRMLYACHLAAALTVGLLFRFYKPTHRPRANAEIIFHAEPLGTAIAQSIHAAVKNMLYVCGLTVVFAVVISFLPDAPLLRGALELTNGTAAIAATAMPTARKLRLLSLVLGFGGVSVHLQIAGILSDCDLSAKTCVAGKVLQAVFSYIYVCIIL